MPYPTPHWQPHEHPSQDAPHFDSAEQSRFAALLDLPPSQPRHELLRAFYASWALRGIVELLPGLDEPLDLKLAISHALAPDSLREWSGGRKWSAGAAFFVITPHLRRLLEAWVSDDAALIATQEACWRDTLQAKIDLSIAAFRTMSAGGHLEMAQVFADQIQLLTILRRCLE